MDEASIIAEEIERKEGREVHGRIIPLDKRVRVHDLMEAARISIKEADEKNRHLDSTVDAIAPLIEDAAGSLEEASALLAEIAEQVR